MMNKQHFLLLLLWSLTLLSCQESSSSANDFEMVYVKGGTFMMGCNKGEGDCLKGSLGKHRVELADFYMGKYELTQAEWLSVMGTNPSVRPDCLNCPVEMVSWEQVQVFIERLNAKTGKKYRLPTEAEWEYAARGGQAARETVYAGSDTIELVAWFVGNAGVVINDEDREWFEEDETEELFTNEVGLLRANELGLHDMTGNIEEFCSDWYAEYNVAEQINPQGPSAGEKKVVRGGCFANVFPFCQNTVRSGKKPDEPSECVGFRLVLPYEE